MRKRRRQSGMTLLEMMIVLAIIALVMGIIVGPRVYAMFVDSREKTTKIKLQKYAYEAYTAWAATHGTGCPATLAELNPYTNNDDGNDAWGHPLVMRCGAELPAGVVGLGVISSGRDEQLGTADDLRSWDR